jgi:hypothetical protein
MQTLQQVCDMSALPPKADMDEHDGDVRFVPKSDICSAAKERLFDHRVGAGEQRGWNGEAKRLCRVQLRISFPASLEGASGSWAGSSITGS